VFDVSPIAPGWYLVSDGRTHWKVAVADGTDGSWVFTEGLAVTVEPISIGSGRTRTRARSDSGVMAPMPATVVSLRAKPGDTVNEGDTIMVLEAMKMELPIRAPRSGIVKAVHCTKGELVQPGVNLLEIE
jgi:biotin carboxyl carrier protein